MPPLDPASAREFLEAIIAAFAVLGGTMAYFSGFEAFIALVQSHPRAVATECINQGIGTGFGVGAPAAVAALIIMGWGW